MAKRKQTELIPGHATHRRTEGDYMAALLDTVTLDDWRDVVAGALRDAKGGDPQARNWLAAYLIGRPDGKAPTPLTVIVNQLQGSDPVINRLADKLAAPTFDFDFDRNNNRAEITQQLQAELAEKMDNANLSGKPATMRVSGEFDPQ